MFFLTLTQKCSLRIFTNVAPYFKKPEVILSFLTSLVSIYMFRKPNFVFLSSLQLLSYSELMGLTGLPVKKLESVGRIP